MYVSKTVPCQIGHEGFCCTYGYSLWDSGSCRIYLVQLFTKQYNETYTARKAALEAKDATALWKALCKATRATVK